MANHRDHPLARPHGSLNEVFPDVFFVTGTMGFPIPIPMHMSRNMVVVRDAGSLVIVNSVRLGDAGLAALDSLGRVKHVVRLAGFHGSDDPFYKERYGATVWAVRNQPYSAGFALDPAPSARYFSPDREVEAGTDLPLAGSLYTFPSCKVGEGLLVLDHEGGIVVAGDALQNWAVPDEYFNWLGRLVMRPMGFIRAHNVGPGWLKQARPAAAELRGILDLPFAHVLPAHGTPVVGDARTKFRPAIEAAANWADAHAR